MADQNTRRIIFALLIIVIGAVLLADNLYWFDFSIPYYFTRWYSFIFFVGLFLLLVRDKKGPGLTLIVISLFFLLRDVLHVSVWSLWPIVLIVVGILILVRKGNTDMNTDGFSPGDEDYIDEFATFSGPSRKVTTQNFKGGKINTVFGGIDVDLSEAKLAPGKNVLDIFTIFGGSNIYVPQDWNVVVKVTPIFGGYDDQRAPGFDTDDETQLVITGLVLFGGGEVKTKFIRS